MVRRWWAAAPVAFVVAGALAFGSGVAAQDTTIPDDDLGLVAEIHAGSCADVDADVAFALGGLTRTGDATEETDNATGDAGNGTEGGFADLEDGLVGDDDAAVVWTTRETIDASPEDLFDDVQSYVIVIGEEGPTGAVAACGDLGGVVANGALTVALLPGVTMDSGTIAGIAVFDVPNEVTLTIDDEDADADETPTTDDGANEQTRVTVHVFQLAQAADAAPTEVPADEASPVTDEETDEETDDEMETVPTVTVEPAGSPAA